MRIDVIGSVNEIIAEEAANKCVVVIDVLRATSTIVTALANGADGVVPVETVPQAKQWKQPGIWLGGERYGKKIAGFDAGNSPEEYTGPAVRGKKVVLTTSNGTRAFFKAHRASCILAGSFLNLSACAEAVKSIGRDTMIICAGGQDRFALEDGLCAGCLIERLHNMHGTHLQLNDFGKMLHYAARHTTTDLVKLIRECTGGQRLRQLGFDKDIACCARVDLYSVVPVLDHDHIIRPFSGTKVAS
ncbi:2-phosphosulfolactate phosphatase [Paenibacillus sp. P96]|uniref:Probable 2-phosphosulfolactate phosphatase n=1 Tax=Paenibacillus zeirhizosphaerae TaxID=2987519 RepID=A0ABT9FPT8_9BACL|nr:2-phosphosulfolactate phosphatase [Paenibacillus sp. P96]MDP4096753.1 2-phosphosulfolactate phosphatase [Paenibacillus sp. P96]